MSTTRWGSAAGSASAGTQAFDDCNGGVGWTADGEEDFKIGILLIEETAEVLFEALVGAGKGFENADGRSDLRFGGGDGPVSGGGDDGEDAID